MKITQQLFRSCPNVLSQAYTNIISIILYNNVFGVTLDQRDLKL